MFSMLSKGRQAALLVVWALLAGGVILVTDARATGGDKGKTDLEAFQGTWKIAGLTKDGMDIPEDFLKDIKLTVKADMMTINIMGVEKKASFKIDASKTPKHIDLAFEDQKDGGAGIYSIDGDVIKICASDNKERPKEFKGDGGRTLIVLKKTKEEPAARGKTDKEKLQGTWKVASAVKGGQEAPKELLEKIKLSFKGDKAVITIDSNDIEGDYKFDSSKKPRTIDFDIAGMKSLGIYELDGDDLKICMTEGGKDRPTEFKGTAATTTLMVLKREKAKEPQAPAPPQQAPQATTGGKSDKDKLQGTWTISSISAGGKDLPAEVFKDASMTIKDDKIALKFLGQNVDITMKLNDKEKPGQIDMTAEGKTAKGIYEIDGDTLKLCMTTAGTDDPRPKDFKNPGTATIMVLKRAKASQPPAGIKDEPAARGKSDKDKWQGTWTVKTVTVDGKDLPAEFIKDSKMVVKGDMLTLYFSEKPKVIEFKLDTKERPAQIDMTGEGKTALGIYAFEGDTLKLCISDPQAKGGPRPKEFKTGSGNKEVLLVFERAKDSKDSKQEPAPEPPAARGKKSDQDKMQGNWALESGIDGGMEMPKELLTMLKFIVKGDTVEIQLSKDLSFNLKFKLDETKTPRQIDMSMDGKPSAIGIYEVTADSIKFCLVDLENSKTRPTKFESPAGSTTKLVILKRIKSDKQAAAAAQGDGGLVALQGAKKDEDLLQGTWQVTKVTPDKNDSDKIQLIFKGDKIGIAFEGKEKAKDEAHFKLDATKKPKHINIMPVGGNDKTIEGIYELNGNMLKICFAEGGAGGGRPTEFKSDGKNIIVLELRRVPGKDEQVNIQERPDFFVAAATRRFARLP